MNNKKKFNFIFTIEDINSGEFSEFVKSFINTLDGNLIPDENTYFTDQEGNRQKSLRPKSNTVLIKDKENFSILKKFKFVLLEDSIIFWNCENKNFYNETDIEEIKKYLQCGIYKDDPYKISGYDDHSYHKGGLLMFQSTVDEKAEERGGGYLDIKSENGKIKLIFYRSSHDFGFPHYKTLESVREKISNKEITFDFSEYEKKEQERVQEEQKKEQERILNLKELNEKDRFIIRFFYEDRIAKLKKLLNK